MEGDVEEDEPCIGVGDGQSEEGADHLYVVSFKVSVNHVHDVGCHVLFHDGDIDQGAENEFEDS